MTPIPRPSSPGAGACGELLARLDEVLGERVLLVGSLPPRGRDVDLLVSRAQQPRLEERLTEMGYVGGPRGWIDPRHRMPLVELVPEARWRLPRRSLAKLMQAAEPLAGCRWLCQPAPEHALLIMARKAPLADPLPARTAQRVREELARDPAAWERASAQAPAWRAGVTLELLRLRVEGHVVTGIRLQRARRERVVRAALARQWGGRLADRLRRHRGSVVAFSGLDGSGKSLQTRMLAETLEATGAPVEVAWPPSRNALFSMNASLKRRLRRLLQRMGRSSAAESEAWASAPPDADTYVAPLPRQIAPVTHLLAFVVAAVQAGALRRSLPRPRLPGTIVIYDRYVLDAAVYVAHRWGSGRPVPLQRALIRLLARRPTAAYLLEVPPEVAYQRKDEYPLVNLRERAVLYARYHAPLGVESIDGLLSPEEVHAEILRSLWPRLQRG